MRCVRSHAETSLTRDPRLCSFLRFREAPRFIPAISRCLSSDSKDWTQYSRFGRRRLACGEVLYWCNRHDLEEPLQRRGYEPPMHELGEELADCSLHGIRQFEQMLSYHIERMPGELPVVRSISRKFPNEVLEICRRFLSFPMNQVGYFQHYSESDRTRDKRFAIEVLGRNGNSTDLRSLRRYANDVVVGTTAIGAIKRIEERLE